MAVVLVSLAVVLVHPVGGTMRGVLASAGYVSNRVVGLDAGGLGLPAHTWSLSVEELGAGVLVAVWSGEQAAAVVGWPARLCSG